jgi:aminopeptidase N
MKRPILIILALLFSAACNVNKQNVQNTEISDVATSLNKTDFNKYKNYKASEPKIHDLIHTSLDIRFDIPKKIVFGTAEITLKSHFYPSDSLELDARGFEIKSVSLVQDETTLPLKYSYNSPKLTIQLNKTYTADEKFTVQIVYQAQPASLRTRHSSFAVSDDRGLYFIDADTNDPQIWTQGETSSNSCWFPTIDAPNQRMTQEIKITVPRDLTTLSNGTLVASLLNEDGTRTDLWRQTQTHAPYLTMIAAGKFTIKNDYWRKLPVDLYIPKGTEIQAQSTFDKTTKMIDFYSRCFQYDYPWDKYAQIVVKNFVSGAMENTSATVFGDYVIQGTENDLYRDNESVVAHELSHHWFGDLITCESWANTGLNEGFATYCEYLWFEHEYGRDEADLHLYHDYTAFMFENSYKKADYIRYDYADEGDMFDVHSYQKGALLLHMLRKTIGDDAFFSSLALYLKKHQYSSVEIHDFRLAVEEVTGKDMNWFFNQWFLNKGIPELKIDYSYNEETGMSGVLIKQIQDLTQMPLYVIPLKIAFWMKDTIIYKDVMFTDKEQTFLQKTGEKPEFIDFDSKNMLLCKSTENKTKEEWIAQLIRAPFFDDKNKAVEALTQYNRDADLQRTLLDLSKHSFWYYRYYACELFSQKTKGSLKKEISARLKEMSENDENQFVKEKATEELKRF